MNSRYNADEERRNMMSKKCDHQCGSCSQNCDERTRPQQVACHEKSKIKKVIGIIMVTSPQQLVSMIVKKAVNMANMMNIPILGLVENMSYLLCDTGNIESAPLDLLQEVLEKIND